MKAARRASIRLGFGLQEPELLQVRLGLGGPQPQRDASGPRVPPHIPECFLGNTKEHQLHLFREAARNADYLNLGLYPGVPGRVRRQPLQRGYQANAKMITTTDQIMQETMNMTQ